MSKRNLDDSKCIDSLNLIQMTNFRLFILCCGSVVVYDGFRTEGCTRGAFLVHVFLR